jgi:hypothetical protein
MIRVLLFGLLFSVAGQARHLARPALHCSVEGETERVSSASLCPVLAKRLLRVIQVVDGAGAYGESVRFVRSDVDWTVVWSVRGRPRAWTKLSLIELESRPLSALAHAAVLLSTARPCEPSEQSSECRTSAREVVDPWPDTRRTAARRVAH